MNKIIAYLEILHIKYYIILCVVFLCVFLLEYFFPLRKNQPFFKKGLFLDLCYVFFLFFVLDLFFLPPIIDLLDSSIISEEIKEFQSYLNSKLPSYLIFIIILFIYDFSLWLSHFLLHNIPFLWEIHKTHHASKEISSTSNFRANFLEYFFSKTITYSPGIILFIFFPKEITYINFIYFVVSIINHSNINIDYKFFNYLFVSPNMHIWHHVKELPFKNGRNFGFLFSIWDRIFKTNYTPYNAKDLEYGILDDDYPKTFVEQQFYPFRKLFK